MNDLLKSNYLALRSDLKKPADSCIQIARLDAARGRPSRVRKPSRLSHGDVIRTRAKDGRKLTLVVSIQPDSDMGPPWEEHHGHGPVSEWTTATKTAGQMILNKDGRSKRYYDFQEACAIARRDGWGLSPEHKAELTAKLGRAPTGREIAARAAMLDFFRLQAWCDDSWSWIGVCLFELPRDQYNSPRDVADSPDWDNYKAGLWGIESDATDYHDEVARELLWEARA